MAVRKAVKAVKDSGRIPDRFRDLEKNLADAVEDVFERAAARSLSDYGFTLVRSLGIENFSGGMGGVIVNVSCR